MKPNYIPAESTIKPLTIELADDTVYIRKDIKTATRTNISGDSVVYWSYLEARLTINEFNEYSALLNISNIEQLLSYNNTLIAQSANIDVNTEYIACLVELDGAAN